MKTFLKPKEITPVEILESLKENNQANLFEVAMEMVDIYVQKYNRSQECIYITELKKHDTYIEFIKHLGNKNVRNELFPIEKQLIKSNKLLVKLKTYIYNSWRKRKLTVDLPKLVHQTSCIRFAFEELVDEFTPYNKEDDELIKIKLGIK